MLLSNLDIGNNILKRNDSMIDYDQSTNNDEEENKNDNYAELDDDLKNN